jgi:Flp pilus assembly protein CpaB
MKSRLLTLMVAILTGAVAVASVYLYVQRVEEDSARGLRPQTVLVAGRSFEAGTTGAEIRSIQDAVRTERIPSRYVAPGALSDPSSFVGRVLATDLAAGDQLMEDHFAGSASDAFARQLPEGHEALSLPVEHVRGVAGHVAAGDKLNAFSAGDESTSLIAKSVSVIEVQAPSTEDFEATATMVLAVTPESALALIDAQERSGLWFTLIPPGETS